MTTYSYLGMALAYSISSSWLAAITSPSILGATYLSILGALITNKIQGQNAADVIAREIHFHGVGSKTTRKLK